MRRPPFARGPVLGAAAAQAALLTALSAGYGYHRDELYFRMLPPAWGYVDQPPLAPFLVRTFTLLADETWAIRLPATLCAALSVIVVAAITREAGGGRAAQSLAAWGYGFAVMPLSFGHVAVTPAFDLPLWPAIVLCAMRALLRREPRWWLAVGALLGLATWLKLLVALLAVSLLAGLLLIGPRRPLRSPWLWAGALLAAAIAAPNAVYQWANGWPQLAVGAGLAEGNAGHVRLLMWPFLLVLLGPPLVIVWWAGLRELLRRPAWRPIRGIAVALPILLGLVFAMGSQLYYPLGLLAAVYAIGCVPVAERRGTLPGVALDGPVRAWVAGWVGVNALAAALVGLPVLPEAWQRVVPVAAINPVARESIGWPAYVGQIAAVHDTLPPEDRARAVVLTANYGEAGAVDRYGPALGLPRAYSGHNGLGELGPPPAERTVAVVVGDVRRDVFARCEPAGTLAHPVPGGEENGAPLAVCRDPRGGWAAAWPPLRHLG